ncbi:hypothetical protein Tco_0212381 [Tanacetum coccineum]
MIGSLMYLTASRPDIMFAVCACARFQVTPKASHLNVVKRFFRHLKLQPKLGYMYPTGFPFLKLEAFSDMTMEEPALTENQQQVAVNFLIVTKIVHIDCVTAKRSFSLKGGIDGRMFLSTTKEGLQAIYASINGHKKLITEDSLRRHLKLDDAEGISSLSNEEIFEHLAHMGYVTNSESLTFFKEEYASMPYDSPLHAVHSHGSAEGSVQQHDLTALVNKLNNRIDGLEKDLQQTKKTYSTALTKLVLRVKKLEYKLKSGKARRKAKIVLSDDEEIAEDSSKQGRKISQIDEDPTISLVQDEEETPTEIIEEHGSGEKGEMEISTANIQVSTASPPKVSTAVPHVYTRRSAKDKGKANKGRTATPKKEAKLCKKKKSKTKSGRQLGNCKGQLDQRQEINPMSIAQARRNMITYLKNQGGYKESYFKRMSERRKVKEEDVNPELVLIEKKAVGIRRKPLARRRASDKQGQDSSKRQKKEKESADYDKEKDELRIWLAVVPDEEAIMDPEVLHTKYPIVDWESQSLGNMHVYKIIRADGYTSYHKTFERSAKKF